jgi:hypothetical protein
MHQTIYILFDFWSCTSPHNHCLDQWILSILALLHKLMHQTEMLYNHLYTTCNHNYYFLQLQTSFVCCLHTAESLKSKWIGFDFWKDFEDFSVWNATSYRYCFRTKNTKYYPLTQISCYILILGLETLVEEWFSWFESPHL